MKSPQEIGKKLRELEGNNHQRMESPYKIGFSKMCKAVCDCFIYALATWIFKIPFQMFQYKFLIIYFLF